MLTRPLRPYLGQAIIVTVTLLSCLGLLAIYASSALKGAEQFHDPYFYLKKQAMVGAVGFVVLGALQFVPLRWIEHLVLPLLALSLLLLGLIFVPGLYAKIGGASRWLKLAGLRFQPFELAKLGLVFFLAKNLSRPGGSPRCFKRGILPNLFLLGLFAGLLMRQPDFGTTVLLFMVTGLMIYIAGAPWRFVSIALVGLLISAGAAIAVAPYRLRRILSFLNPWADLQHGGFQIIQSYLGFQNGGFWGAGLGESRQKLFFLPEAHTDFIFAVIGEELGFVGSLFVCLLFLFLIAVGFRIAFLCRQPFQRLLAFGLTSLTACQAAINLGVVMGLLPTKGIPLPFISSGASSLLTFLFAAGVLARLGREARHDEAASV